MWNIRYESHASVFLKPNKIKSNLYFLKMTMSCSKEMELQYLIQI